MHQVWQSASVNNEKNTQPSVDSLSNGGPSTVICGEFLTKRYSKLRDLSCFRIPADHMVATAELFHAERVAPINGSERRGLDRQALNVLSPASLVE